MIGQGRPAKPQCTALIRATPPVGLTRVGAHAARDRTEKATRRRSRALPSVSPRPPARRGACRPRASGAHRGRVSDGLDRIPSRPARPIRGLRVVARRGDPRGLSPIGDRPLATRDSNASGRRTATRTRSPSIPGRSTTLSKRWRRFGSSRRFPSANETTSRSRSPATPTTRSAHALRGAQ
jgi:hypothetical protein